MTAFYNPDKYVGAEKQEIASLSMEYLYNIFQYSLYSKNNAAHIFELLKSQGYNYSNVDMIYDDMQNNTQEFNDFCKFLFEYSKELKENASVLIDTVNKFETLLKL